MDSQMIRQIDGGHKQTNGLTDGPDSWREDRKRRTVRQLDRDGIIDGQTGLQMNSGQPGKQVGNGQTSGGGKAAVLNACYSGRAGCISELRFQPLLLALARGQEAGCLWGVFPSRGVSGWLTPSLLFSRPASSKPWYKYPSRPATGSQDSPIMCAGFPEPPQLLHSSQQSQGSDLPGLLP